MLGALAARVRAALASEPRELSPPHATVAMVSEECTQMHRAPREEGPRECLRIALRDGTPGVEFLGPRNAVVATSAMGAGDALLYDTRAWHREPVGDWQRTVDFFF